MPHEQSRLTLLYTVILETRMTLHITKCEIFIHRDDGIVYTGLSFGFQFYVTLQSTVQKQQSIELNELSMYLQIDKFSISLTQNGRKIYRQGMLGVPQLPRGRTTEEEPCASPPLSPFVSRPTSSRMQ